MPIAPPPNYQLCTYTTANNLAVKLRNLGISVSNLIEIDTNGDRADTTDENWTDSGNKTQYVADIWGPVEQNLGITDAMFEQNGYTVHSFTQLATSANVPSPDSAIMALNGVVEGINRVLQREMK